MDKKAVKIEDRIFFRLAFKRASEVRWVDENKTNVCIQGSDWTGLFVVAMQPLAGPFSCVNRTQTADWEE